MFFVVKTVQLKVKIDINSCSDYKSYKEEIDCFNNKIDKLFIGIAIRYLSLA